MAQMLIRKSLRHHEYFEPAEEADLEMFMHCTDGCIAASWERLQKHKPVFTAHGIDLKIQTN